MDMVDDLPLAIKLKSINDYLTCPVCMCALRKTSMTVCGHRFCAECIKECIGRHHKCPICNTPLILAQVLKDPTFDAIIATVQEESEQSEKQYFEQLISTVTTDDELTSSTSAQTQKIFLNPIESVLKKHLKSGFSSHNRYYQDLSVDFQKRFTEIDTECLQMTSDLKSQEIGQQELLMQTADIEDTYKRKKEDLAQEMTDCGQMVANAFDRYLTEQLPSLSVLPIEISIQLLDKNIAINEITLQPSHTLSDVRSTIMAHMEESGDKVIEFGDNVRFFCFGPFSKRKNCEMKCVTHDLMEDHSHSNAILLQDQMPLVLHLAIKPGSVIAVYGDIKLNSDLPKTCFANMFEKGKSCTMDYFTCQTCGFNWVCRPCMEECHKDHEVIPLIMNHQPTWACCYCAKKNKCKIQRMTLDKSLPGTSGVTKANELVK